ncbi:hypothetical protein [Pseudomonas viridiflava]|uniref:hypothetical protein n=1 Tax=Pseudomonas viridiflava TaxID=33069 RepID=UPI002EB8DA97|nr:hypothetical protein [Pseudomonas viridiflava]
MSDCSNQKDNSIGTVKRRDKWNHPVARTAWAVIISAVISKLSIWLISYVIGKAISWEYYIIPCAVLLVILIFRALTCREMVLTQDWQMLSTVANSKALMLISVALTVVPLALSASQAVNRQYLFPFDLYLYWLSGISFFAFILVYKATAPTIFMYISYRDLIDREGSVRVLRDSFSELRRLADARKSPFSPARQVLVPSLDVDAICTLDIQNTQHQEHIYFLTREYTRYLKGFYRLVLSILLVAPIFFVLTITFSKMFAVGVQSVQTAQCYDGWIKATYWNMLKTNPFIVTPEMHESIQQCLRGLAEHEANAAN